MSESSEITAPLHELRSRLWAKMEALHEMATKEYGDERARLRAKASGISLAIDCVEDEIRLYQAGLR